jgi:hypothetical protein
VTLQASVGHAKAESLGYELCTDGQQLLRRIERDLPFVRWIGDQQQP